MVSEDAAGGKFYHIQRGTINNSSGNDPIGIGIRTLPIGFGIIFGALLGLVLIGVTKGRTKPLLIFWTIAMTGFVGAMSAATINNITPVVYPIITLASISVGAVIIPCSIIAQVVCPTEFIGTVTAITLAIRYIGGAIGFTVYYNIFYHKLNPGYIMPAATASLTDGGLANFINIGPNIINDITDIYTMASISPHYVHRGRLTFVVRLHKHNMYS
jgi:hypothetical protein